MHNQISAWRRLSHGETPIYSSMEEPNWFVPNRAGDEILRHLSRGVDPGGGSRSSHGPLSFSPALSPRERTGDGCTLVDAGQGEILSRLTFDPVKLRKPYYESSTVRHIRTS